MVIGAINLMRTPLIGLATPGSLEMFMLVLLAERIKMMVLRSLQLKSSLQKKSQLL
jgi:hypothetical protein